MHPDLKASVLRILRPDGDKLTTVGTGFLVADGLAVTCAHVVTAANRGPGQAILVEFYLNGVQRQATVLDEPYWSDRDHEDVAFLTIPEQPKDVHPVRPSSAAGCEGKDFISLGFPASSSFDADTPQGKIAGLVRPKQRKGSEVLRIQGMEIEPGMSGGPVLRLDTGCVVGMITEYEDVRNVRRVGAVPTDTLARMHPQVKFWQPVSARLLSGFGLDYSGSIQNFLDEYLGKPFGGRSQELEELDNWMTTPDASQKLLISAEAGRGKSALLVNWYALLVERGLAQTAFVPVSLRFQTNRPEVFLLALAARLARAYKDESLRYYSFSSADQWREVCLELLKRPLPDDQPLVVILDGLDEAADERLFANIFPKTLPQGVRVVVAARYLAGDQDEAGWLRRLGWDHQTARTMHLPLLGEAGLRDVLQRMGDPLRRIPYDNNRLVKELLRLTEGEPLLIRLYVEDLLAMGEGAVRLRPEELATRPKGLEGYLEGWWQDQEAQWREDGREPRQARKDILNFLTLCSAALGPLSTTDIRGVAGELFDSTPQVRDIAQEVRRFIIGDGQEQGYVYSHPKLAFYFWEQLDDGEGRAWQKRFADYGKTVFRQLQTEGLLPEEIQARRYIIQHYTAHLERAGASPEDFYEMMSKAWLEARQSPWVDGTPDGFLSDVQAAWEKGEAGRAEALGQCVRAVLCFASVASLSSNIPTELIIAAVRKNTISLALGAVMARRKTEAKERSECLGKLAEIAPHDLRESLFSEAFEAARQIGDEGDRSNVLAALAEHLPEEKKVAVFQEALEAARQIGDEGSRSDALAALAERLPDLCRAMKRSEGDVLQELLRLHAAGERNSLLLLIRALTPALYRLGGERVTWETYEAIRDTAEWWP